MEITYEGTSQVKENKVSLLVHKYELFKVKRGEETQEMFDRFNDVLNGMKALGKNLLKLRICKEGVESFTKILDIKEGCYIGS